MKDGCVFGISTVCRFEVVENISIENGNIDKRLVFLEAYVIN